MVGSPFFGLNSLRGLSRARLFSTASHAFDVAVIGGGPGGYVSAIKAAQLGLKTAIIEKRSALGGTCLNIGCIPSKCLLHSSHEYSALKSGGTLKKIGVSIDSSSAAADLTAMHRHRTRTVQMLTKGVKGLMDKNGVTQFHGLGRFTNANTLEVDITDGASASIEAKHYVVATGSDSSSLPFLKIDGDVIVTSTEALEFPEVPESMAVIGGGVIGLELGSVWARLGTKSPLLSTCRISSQQPIWTYPKLYRSLYKA
ncbi:Dihydrolipoyl dehydrogenase, putative [Perkinsus marinus ATCC 50983]|uniref:Dihydrolipoyl dehydrogenase, putative n=1 Tax=Perkinsus marinus (strain ATCC 50983 / TXsc) TaxID=423536 RepID=C5K9F9_PERM5|nr:Dihydrolipoyl dehydrogenase, putative [Perkinsus marinus ATCC 50983]EER18731.1 Dihydrolipoyl dehydrogenase, putative [Perkinsus marinus ATCC 50983]|eukprot:XP_002786935.1 Dihydrolipoyl dehydrogenase, putative [Perkinsus marinus ATCC 50983]